MTGFKILAVPPIGHRRKDCATVHVFNVQISQLIISGKQLNCGLSQVIQVDSGQATHLFIFHSLSAISDLICIMSHAKCIFEHACLCPAEPV